MDLINNDVGIAIGSSLSAVFDAAVAEQSSQGCRWFLEILGNCEPMPDPLSIVDRIAWSAVTRETGLLGRAVWIRPGPNAIPWG